MPGTRSRPAEPRVVVVTGASSGIGRATALAFARRGDHLVLTARSTSSLEEVAAESRALGATATVVTADLAEPGAVREVLDAALAAHGHVDVWVGAASVFAYGHVDQLPRAAFERVIAVNLLAQAETVRFVVPHLRQRGRGSIVIVGSVFSRVAAPWVGAYVASKHAVLGLAESARLELRGTGVSISTVLPATVDTPIYQHAANHSGHRTRPLPPYVDARRVAAAIVRRADRPRPVTTVGVVQGSSWLLSVVARPLYGLVIRSAQRRIALGPEHAEATDGALFDPQPSRNAIDGGWRAH